MPRFFADAAPDGDGIITIKGDDARHIALSLRSAVGDKISVCRDGKVYGCRLLTVRPDEVRLFAEAVSDDESEPPCRVSVFVGNPKGTKLDFIVEKCTELGAFSVTPFLSERCVSRPDGGALLKRRARLERIAREAAMQCGRGRAPEIGAALDFGAAVKAAAEADFPLFIYENEKGVTLRDAARGDPEWSVVLLRYFNPVGAHKSGRIGEHPNGIPNNLMPYITQTAVGKRDHLNVFGKDYPTPDGTGVRDYIHVVDLAKGHVAAIRYLLAHTGTEVFNLGTGQGYSVLDMVHAFEEANGVQIPYEIAPRRAGDLPTCYADPAKSREVLGWQAELGLKEMCRDSWNWQKQNPNGYES